MNYKYVFLFILSFAHLYAEEDTIKNILSTKLDESKNNSIDSFRFEYTETPLVDILHEWAAAHSKNILLPQGSFAIKTKLTYKVSDPLTLTEFTNLIIKILDIIGYTVKYQDDLIVVIKNDQQPERQSLDVYIATPLANLPSNEQMITYIYYLTNLSIKVSGDSLKTVLTDMLSKNAKIMTDDKSNALILTDKANNIQSAMKIIIELDEGGLRDAAEVIPIYYTSATLVEDLFKKLIPQQKNGEQVEAITGAYFPKNTKIIALERTNSLVIMGTTRSINIVKEFIIKYVDHPLESGRSLLHIYDLQYLKAEDFAPVLQNLVKPPSQASQATSKQVGPKQYFQDVIIGFERIRETKEKLQPSGVAGETQGKVSPTAEGAIIGGNRLIIAARHEDWLRIKKLIEELDKPQLQVALEVLIIDVTTTKNKSLGSQLRNKKGFRNSTINDANFQSAQITNPILTPPGTDGQYPPNALAANLLQLASDGSNIASNSAPGSLIISAGSAEMGVWTVWSILNQYLSTSILSQPFLITKNKEKATVAVAQTRLIKGDTEKSTVSALTINYDDVTAGTTVDMLPIVSESGNINLLITVQINEFINVNPDAWNRVTRIVQTNANIKTDEILVLGGLKTDKNIISVTKVPILGDVPLLGWFFKKESKTIQQNNLLIVIHPTIIQPHTAGGVNTFSANKLAIARNNVDESLTLDNLRDPITHWFFRPHTALSDQTIDSYVEETDKLREYEKGKRAALAAAQPTQEKKEINVTQLQELIKNEENPLLLAQNIEH